MVMEAAEAEAEAAIAITIDSMVIITTVIAQTQGKAEVEGEAVVAVADTAVERCVLARQFCNRRRVQHYCKLYFDQKPLRLTAGRQPCFFATTAATGTTMADRTAALLYLWPRLIWCFHTAATGG